jgi:hypothetical protein
MSIGLPDPAFSASSKMSGGYKVTRSANVVNLCGKRRMSIKTSSAPKISGEAASQMRKDEKGRWSCGSPRTSVERLYDNLTPRFLKLDGW